MQQQNRLSPILFREIIAPNALSNLSVETWSEEGTDRQVLTFVSSFTHNAIAITATTGTPYSLGISLEKLDLIRRGIIFFLYIGGNRADVSSDGK